MAVASAGLHVKLAGGEGKVDNIGDCGNKN